MLKRKEFWISLGISAVAALLAMLGALRAQAVYGALRLPAVAPPAGAFPIVWGVLYVLMGVSAFLVYEARTEDSRAALTVYAAQLAVNVLWPYFFFLWQAFVLAFAWIVLLWILVLLMLPAFHKVSPVAAYLQAPYIVWVTFAAYLNLYVALFN